MAYTASCHNGRKNTRGIYSARHNDRNFNSENAEHIDWKKTSKNLYWDWKQGMRKPQHSENEHEFILNLSQAELLYYAKEYSQHVIHQNERNDSQRHSERNKNITDIIQDPKLCPEETIFQLGNINGTVDPEVLVKVVQAFLKERDEKYGKYIHCLDWCLHVDEATPHIHERHVFDCEDKYGDIFPQQEKALEKMGFNLPDPTKKPGKYNNRKMSFDVEMRKRFMEIASAYGVEVEWENVTGGRGHLEKNEFIISQQKLKMEELLEAISENESKLEDTDKFIEEVSQVAYQKACEVVSCTAEKVFLQEVNDTSKKCINELSASQNLINKREINFMIKATELVRNKMITGATTILQKLIGYLNKSDIKKKNLNDIQKATKASVIEILSKKKTELKDNNINKGKGDKIQTKEYEYI